MFNFLRYDKFHIGGSCRTKDRSLSLVGYTRKNTPHILEEDLMIVAICELAGDILVTVAGHAEKARPVEVVQVSIGIEQLVATDVLPMFAITDRVKHRETGELGAVCQVRGKDPLGWHYDVLIGARRVTLAEACLEPVPGALEVCSATGPWPHLAR